MRPSRLIESTRSLAPNPMASAAPTTVPTPCTARTNPSERRVARTLDAVASEIRHSRVISRADGTRSPSWSSPEAIRSRMAATTRRYGGSVRRTVGATSLLLCSGAPADLDHAGVLAHITAGQPEALTLWVSPGVDRCLV